MEVRACANCGKLLPRPASHHRGVRSFCNRECRKAFHRPLVPCRGCDQEFSRDPNQPQRLYCTWECFKASRHITVICYVCGKMFDSYVSEQRKRDERGHMTCCSVACRNVYTSLLLGGDGSWVSSGQNNPKRLSSWHWKRVRIAYLASVDGQCEGCEFVPAEHVHHLYPRALGGPLYDFDNLMAVCRDCHNNMHDQLRAGAFWSSFEGVKFDAELSNSYT